MSSPSGDQSVLYRAIDRFVGKEHLVQVREDFKWIVFDNMENFQRWSPSQQYLKKEALAAKDSASSSKWDQIGFVLGVIATVLSVLFIIPLDMFFSIVGILISLLTLLRRVAVTMLLYDDPYRIYDNRELKFACAWNRAMNGWTSYSVIPMGILDRVTPERYKLALWVLESAIQDEYG